MGRDDRRGVERQSQGGARARALRALTEHGPWLALSLLAALPAILTRHLPGQDLPQHFAAIRVLASLHDPRYGFDSDFVPSLGATYFMPYLAGAGLARIFGAWTAGRLLVATYLVGTLLGARSLARAVTGDGRPALLVAPLLAGPFFVIGLLPFLLGVAALLWALAYAVRFARAPRLGHAIVLALLATVVAGTHPLPFVLFVIGLVILAVAHRRPLLFAPAAPSVLLFARFLFASDAGRLVRGMAVASGERASLRDLFGWIADGFIDRSDDVLVTCTLLLALVATVLARRRLTSERALFFLPAVCLVFYFTGEVQHGYTWPLAPRYAFVGAVLLLALARLPEGRLFTFAGALVAVVALVNDAVHVVAFDREAAGFDAALASMRTRAHVAALIFESRSSVVRFYPFVHFGAYYQLDHGGVVKFTFAGYDHWPIDFRPDRYPPPGGPAVPGWEWHPDRAASELVPYYDHVLLRGHGFVPPSFEKTFQQGAWEVWTRR